MSCAHINICFCHVQLRLHLPSAPWHWHCWKSMEHCAREWKRRSHLTLRIYGLRRQAVAASRSHHANRHNIYQHRVISSSVHASRDLLRTELKNYSFGCNSAYAIWRYPTPSYLILSLCQSISNRRQVRRCQFVVMLPYAPETFNPWFNAIIFNSVCNTINGLMSEVGRTRCSMLVLGIHIYIMDVSEKTFFQI